MEFKEYMIKRKKDAKETILTALLYLAATIIAIACFIGLASWGGIGTLLGAGCYYAAYRIASKFNREFEYIITGDCIDIDVIYNAKSRKRLISFTMENAEIIASVNDANHKQLLKGEYQKVIDATSGYGNSVVYFAVVDKGGRQLVKFEPPHAALEALRKFAPSKVVITD